jgi:hypothetical protein
MARESLGVIGRCRPAYRRTTDALNNLGWLPNLVLRFTVLDTDNITPAPERGWAGFLQDATRGETRPPA